MKNPFRLLRIYRRATSTLDVFDDAAKDQRLYRSPAWWSRAITAVSDLLAVLPLSTEVRVKFQALFLKATMVLGAIGGLAGYLADAGVLQMLPPKYAATIGVISGGAGTLAALLHQSPLTPKPQPEATAQKAQAL